MSALGVCVHVFSSAAESSLWSPETARGLHPFAAEPPGGRIELCSERMWFDWSLVVGRQISPVHQLITWLLVSEESDDRCVCGGVGGGLKLLINPLYHGHLP